MVAPDCWVYVTGGVAVATGVTSAICSLIHLLRAVHRDGRVEEEQRIVGLDHALGAGKSPVQDNAVFDSRLTQLQAANCVQDQSYTQGGRIPYAAVRVMPDRRGIPEQNDKYSSTIPSALKTRLPTTSHTDAKPATRCYKLLQRSSSTSPTAGSSHRILTSRR